MIAYYVTKKAYDSIVLPQAGRFCQVDAALLRRFLADSPDFANWPGDDLEGLKPEDFGTVIATREDDADPVIRDQETWNQQVLKILNPRV